MQFMSRRLLRTMAGGSKFGVTEVADDIESFFWSLFYTVLRKLVENKVGDTARERGQIHSVFKLMFGGTTAGKILNGRSQLESLVAVFDLLSVQKVLSMDMAYFLIHGIEHINQQVVHDRFSHAGLYQLAPTPTHTMDPLFSHAGMKQRLEITKNSTKGWSPLANAE
ncbi:hypothetical protein BC628DRAFT_812258 [Trametes gibbosa]|nr:hypothetical protein BC628DRAFT_812258 [Trametes gibbosa]